MILQAVYVAKGADRLIGSAWAVTNEICCYLLIGLGVTRTRECAIWALIASMAVTGAMYFSTPKTLSDLYFPVASAFLPFAVGGFLAHQVQRMRPASHLTNVSMLVFGVVGVVVCMKAESIGVLGEHIKTTIHVLYFSLLPASAAIIALYRIKVDPRLRSLDDVVGRFSYPIYLLHGPMGLAAAATVPRFAGFGGTLSITIAMSAVFLVLIDNPVNRIRSLVRNRMLPGRSRAGRASKAESDALTVAVEHPSPITIG
jgi:peptidoglycan/LPS O-acetylase OafA/YrhL